MSYDGEGGCWEPVVDLRVIILTYNRPSSLLKLLESLNNLEMDEDRGMLEVWVDKSRDDIIDLKTLEIAKSFRWSGGRVKVVVQRKHKGLIGQWLNCWKPKSKNRKIDGEENDYEIGLILEDDLVVSPYAYRWLKGARNHFRNHKNVSGISLSDEMINAKTGAGFQPRFELTGPSLMYQLISSWGYAPDPDHWLAFLEWYQNNYAVLKPYVPGIIMTSWFKEFERKKKTDTMWTMWFIYYTYHHNLYTLFPNLPRNQTTSYLNKTHGRRPKNCLVYNRKEPGLHYSSKAVSKYPCLSFKWSQDFLKFKKTQMYYLFNTTRLNI